MTLERTMQTYDIALDEAMQAVTTALRRRGTLEHRPPRTATVVSGAEAPGVERLNGSGPHPAENVERNGRAVVDGHRPVGVFAEPLPAPSEESDQRNVDAWRYFYSRLQVVRSEPADHGANGDVQGQDAAPPT